MRRLLIRWLASAIAIYVAILIVPEITHEGGWGGLVILAAILGLVNALLRPVLKVLSCPLMIVTLGLFTLVINAALLKVTSSLGNVFGARLTVPGILPAVWGALIISIVGMVLSIILGGQKKKD